MTGQAVTTNPLLIMVINMTIVFGVLFLLGYVIEFIRWVDPTRKKESKSSSVEKIKQSVEKQEMSAVVTAEQAMEEKTLVAVITTAIMAYGYNDVKIKSIKKI